MEESQGSAPLLGLLARLLENSEGLLEAIKKRDLSAASVIMGERVGIVEELRVIAQAKVSRDYSDIKSDLDRMIMKIDLEVSEIKKLASEQLAALTNELKGMTALKSIAAYKAQGGRYGY
ncbi:MAG: hypothetical protein ACP5US_00055 [Candidatus Kryptoniota bacterium]